MATANMSRSVSPGAALLRSSRMFSMPPPLSTPVDLSKATKHKSASATTPYPTRLTVTTPHSSRVLGDWGFKRPLPLKTTTKSTFPLVRVKQVDSMEHVTDFQSASDHTITLKKWQEMNISMSVPQGNHRGGASPLGVASGSKPLRSVFEEEDDVTALSPEDKVKKENTRWRFSGPWLAGMTDGEFNHFLSDTVNGKRSEFRAYLKNQLAAKMTEEQKQQAQDAAQDVPEPVQASEISEDALTGYLRELRNDRVLLFQHVSRFLDLAPLAPATTVLAKLGAFNPHQQYTIVGSPYATTGPPVTHPSAGLSYLRTGSFLENHPLYGPQAQHAPVKARVVVPKNSFAGGYQTKLGVAGFIATIPESDMTFRDTRKRFASGLETFLPDVEGGSKVYVKPITASVDADGKAVLRLVVEEETTMNTMVHKELVGETTVFSDAKNRNSRESAPARYRYRRNNVGQGQPMMGDKSSYGM